MRKEPKVPNFLPRSRVSAQGVPLPEASTAVLKPDVALVASCNAPLAPASEPAPDQRSGGGERSRRNCRCPVHATEAEQEHPSFWVGEMSIWGHLIIGGCWA